MSVNDIITKLTKNIILSNSHWLRVTNISSFPKHIKYQLGKLPIIRNCKSNKNNNNKMKILMQNMNTKKSCMYILIEKGNNLDNLDSDTMINDLKSVLSLHKLLNNENEENKKKVLEFEESFQADDEVVI